MHQQKPSKTSSSYNLIKGTSTPLSPFSTLYKVMDRQTNQIWHAKVIDNNVIAEYGLSIGLEYNVEVLRNCRELENVVYVKEMFLKAGNTFIVQEICEETLVGKVGEGFPMFSGEIQDVLGDVVSGLCQLYNEKYATRSLRPQHIVCVDDVWKIQSFVLNSQLHPVQSQYSWSPKYASPEDRKKTQQLSQRQIDEQLVWNVGILGLYMILGPDFQYEKINKDSFIPWAKVKENVSQSLFRFLVKALKVDFRERMRLRELFQNQMFEKLNLGKSLPFQSYSKFFGQQSSDIKKPLSALRLTPQQQQKMLILQNDIQRFKYFNLVQKFVQELPYKNLFDSSLIRYLSFKISYQNLLKIKTQLTLWRRQNPSLANYKLLREIQGELGIFVNKVKQAKINYAKNVRGTQVGKSEVEDIRRSVGIVDQKIPYCDVVDLYMRLAGSIYTLVSRDCANKQNESKQRTICYYSLGAYLIHFYQPQQFKNTKPYETNNILSLQKLIEQAPIKFLITLTQNLIKQHFALNTQI